MPMSVQVDGRWKMGGFTVTDAGKQVSLCPGTADGGSRNQLTYRTACVYWI